MIELSEAQVKKQVEDYLKDLMTRGKLWYCRLNVGTFGRHHNIQGAPKGTADLIVIQPGQVHLEYMSKQQGPGIPVAFTTFIELKSSDGKLRPEQLEFEDKVTKLHCRYCVVRSVDELQEVLKRE